MAVFLFISSQMFAEDMHDMKLAFTKTKLQNPLKYSYNEEYRWVQFSDGSYYKADNTLAVYSVKTMNDISNTLLSNSNQQTNGIVFDCMGFDLEKSNEELSRELYSIGIKSFSWSFSRVCF